MNAFVAVYDLARSPVSYDFIAFLVRARHAAGNAPLHIAIEPMGGMTQARSWGGYDEAETEWRLWNIVIPSCHLAGATVELRRARGGAGDRMVPADSRHPPHSLAPLIAATRRGARLPRLVASAFAVGAVAGWIEAAAARPLVTITLRATEDTARNSNIAAWRRFALAIGDRFRVLFLDDTRNVLGRPLGALAAISVDLRLALYQAAAMNLFVQNGPSGLAIHGGAPFLLFGCGGHVTSPPLAAWAEHWRDLGLNEGDQYPWCRPDQRLIYAPDKLENITAAFADWERSRAAA